MPVDQFNGANNADFAVGDPYTWVQLSSALANPARTNGQVEVTGDDPIMGASLDLGSDDMVVALRIGADWVWDGTHDIAVGPVVRSNNVGGNGGTFYCTSLGTSAGQWQAYCFSFLAGTLNTVVFGPINIATPLPGDIHVLRVSGRPTATLTLAINGQFIASGTNAQIVGGTRGGFNISNTVGTGMAAIDELWLGEDPYAPSRPVVIPPGRLSPLTRRIVPWVDVSVPSAGASLLARRGRLAARRRRRDRGCARVRSLRRRHAPRS
jgi:hypothetical protein